MLPVAGDLQRQEFSHVLSKQAYSSVSDGHLWFSIFSRPPSNSFTRVQRCTCCFVLLSASMLLNILYYDQAQEAQTTPSTNSLSFGLFHISPEQVGSHSSFTIDTTIVTFRLASVSSSNYSRSCQVSFLCKPSVASDRDPRRSHDRRGRCPGGSCLWPTECQRSWHWCQFSSSSLEGSNSEI